MEAVFEAASIVVVFLLFAGTVLGLIDWRD